MTMIPKSRLPAPKQLIRIAMQIYNDLDQVRALGTARRHAFLALGRKELAPFASAPQHRLHPRWPARQASPSYLVHPTGARQIRRATLRGCAPGLADLDDVRFAPGPVGLELELDVGSWSSAP